MIFFKLISILFGTIVFISAEQELENFEITTEKDENTTTFPNSHYVQSMQTIEPSVQTPHEAVPVIERSSIYHPVHHHDPAHHGFWKKKLVWRPRWVKTWQEKKVYVAVWRKMWGPLLLNEWVPIPKPPPGWIKDHFGHGAVITTHTHINKIG